MSSFATTIHPEFGSAQSPSIKIIVRRDGSPAGAREALGTEHSVSTSTLLDTVDFSNDVREIAASSDSQRTARLAAIKSQIAGGTYDVDSKLPFVADILARQFGS